MFDIKKFFSGFNIFDGEKLGKIVFYGILITVGLAVYHQITKPTSHTDIVAKPGSTVTIIQEKQKKKSLETFVEPYVFTETDGRFGGGVRGGVRW